MSKLLFVYGTSSITHGHDLASKALPLVNGDHVFSLQGNNLVQNPGEPFGGGTDKLASSPLRYFADALAGKTGDDIACTSIVVGAHNDWHDGLKLWTRAGAKATLEKIQPLLDDGWQLAGIIIGSDGNFDTDREIATFGHEFHQRMNIWRAELGVPKLPAFLMQSEALPTHHMRPDALHRLHEFRAAEANIFHFDHLAVCVKSNPHWEQMPDSPLHLAVHGQEDFGHAIANAVFDYEAHHPLIDV